MADRNDHRRSWSGGGEEPWRDEHNRRPRERDRWDGGESRSFRDEGRYGAGRAEGADEPWRRERYGALYDQDRTNYGSGWDRDRGGYGQGSQDRGGDRSFDRERRNLDQGEPRRHAHGHEAEPDYRRWRDEQLRMHDRDYEQWRNDQHRRYDQDYHASRRGSPGAGHWRDQGGAGGTSERNYITPETHDYGARLYQEGRDRPSGRMEFGPGRGGGAQRGGEDGRHSARRPGGGGDFMQSSPQVRAASEGWGGRGDPEEFDRHWRERDDEWDRDRARRWDRDDER